MSSSTNKKMVGVKKRELIDAARKNVFIWTAVASAMTILALVVGYFIVKEITYDQSRLSAKRETLSTIKGNIEAADELEKNVQALIANNDLAKAKANPSDTTYKVILDALPVTGDSTVLGSSLLERIIELSGARVKTLTASSLSDADPAAMGLAIDPASTSAASPVDGLTSVTYNFEVEGNYRQLQEMFSDMERSIRPINVTAFELQASEGNRLIIESTGESYYSSVKTIELTERTVE